MCIIEGYTVEHSFREKLSTLKEWRNKREIDKLKENIVQLLNIEKQFKINLFHSYLYEADTGHCYYFGLQIISSMH